MLTKKQKELYDYLYHYVQKYGISPSFEEMKQAIKLKSKSGVHRLVTNLEERGFIKRLKHKARAMEIIKYFDNKEKVNERKSETLIPLYGSIAAGNPIEAINLHDEENINIPSSMISNNHKYFGLSVKGDSMINEGIMDGDIAIIKHINSVDNGKIAAVLVKGEDITLKKITVRDSSVTLIPANSIFKEKVYNILDIEVQGELAGIIRKYN